MTEYQEKVAAVREQFADLLRQYGLEASNGNSTRYPIHDNLNYLVVSFQSKACPAKGNKQLLDRLDADGFTVWKVYSEDPKTGRRRLIFYVNKDYPIHLRGDKE